MITGIGLEAQAALSAAVRTTCWYRQLDISRKETALHCGKGMRSKQTKVNKAIKLNVCSGFSKFKIVI